LNTEGRVHLAQAAEHLCAAAGAGCNEACQDLAWLILNRVGGSLISGDAIGLLKQAAGRGHGPARAYLALLADEGGQVQAQVLERYLSAAESAEAAVAEGPKIGLRGPRRLRLPNFLGKPDPYIDALSSLSLVKDSVGLAAFDLDSLLIEAGWEGPLELGG
jgi:TPR repeat protein